MSQPGVIADEAWLRQLYGDHVYGREHPGADEVLDVPATSLRAAHRRRVLPSGSLLVLVGDLTPARALDQVAAALAGWDTAGTPTSVPKVPAVAPGPLRLVDRPGAVQSNLRIGGDGVARTDPSYAAAELANALFGGYFSSRLTMNIREDKGYTYSPRSSLRHGGAASCFLTSTEVATEVTAPAHGRDRLRAGPDGQSAAVRRGGVGHRAVPRRHRWPSRRRPRPVSPGRWPSCSPTVWTSPGCASTPSSCSR